MAEGVHPVNSAERVFEVFGAAAYFGSLAAVCLVWMRWCRRFDHWAVFAGLGVGVPFLTLYPSFVMFVGMVS